MKNSPKYLGLVQALGHIAYVGLFAFLVHTLSPILEARFGEPTPALGMAFILLLLVTSALTCASIAFGYPVYLFFQDKKEISVQIVLWNIGWLIAVVILGLAIALVL